MKQRGLAPKGTPERLVQEARMAWDRSDRAQCAELLERASRELPGEIGLLLRLGAVYGALYDYEAAERTFERACRDAPPDRLTAGLAQVAETARNFFQPDIAQRYFKQAAERDDATPEMLASMAEFCERHGDREDANRLIARALDLNNACEKALLVRGRLLARADELTGAEQEFKHLLEHTQENEIRIRAGSELGAVLDRQGRYDEAMEQFVRAKTLARPAAEAQIAPRKLMRQRWAQMRSQISPEILERWADSAGDLRPQRRVTLLAGHPRSGTTLLEQVLDSHPDIVSIEETDHFFLHALSPLRKRCPADTPVLKMLESASKELLEAYRDRYFQAADLCAGEALGDRLLVDKNPALTIMLPALVRVFPEIKILIALRDPRDVVLSCFLQPVLSVDRVTYPYLSLETTVDGYVAVMQTWRTVAPMLKNPWLEVRYEDMVDDLEAVSRRTLDFLGVAWDERVLDFNTHARRKGVRSPTYADVTQKIFKRARGRWRNYQKHLEPHLGKLEPFIRAFDYE